MVAFVGGGGFHLAVGVGEGVAWFPLGPREVYVPPYRVSRRYVDNVNITNTRVNITQVTNVYNTYVTNNNVTRMTYVNQRNPRAVTAVSRDTFVNARPVNRNLAQVNARELAERAGDPYGRRPTSPCQRARGGSAGAVQASCCGRKPPRDRHQESDAAAESDGRTPTCIQCAHRTHASKRSGRTDASRRSGSARGCGARK